MPNAQCPMPTDAQCPVPSAQCPAPNSQCPISNATLARAHPNPGSSRSSSPDPGPSSRSSASHALKLGLTCSLSLSLSRTLARALTPFVSPAQVVSLYGDPSSAGAVPTRSRVSLKPLGKEHKKKRRQVDKMLAESPLAQTASFPALPGVTPTKNGGRADKVEVPNLFANPGRLEQVRRSRG